MLIAEKHPMDDVSNSGGQIFIDKRFNKMFRKHQLEAIVQCESF